jgi:cytochrome c oxidase cbb3-type subunit I/II
MLDHTIDFEGIPGKMETLQALGVPYSDDEIEDAVQDARAQASRMASAIADVGGPANLADKEVIAITAYLQRLGTDIRKTN